MSCGEKLKSLNLKLPPAPKPIGSYRPLVITGTAGYISGQISKTADGKIITGRVGAGLSLDQGREAAKCSVLNVLSVIENILGWDNFSRFVRLSGYVQTGPDFHDIPKVLDAASDLLVEILGDRGLHTRAAIGAANLPLNAAVEIEAVVEVKV
ncbi:MAG: RidA family protein [Candidatus Omnitrophota bacterium]|nr:RidA family protein [Candidatus Omnitrophota bacterium]